MKIIFFARADHRSTFADYMAENSNLFPPNMQGLITNFCYPETFTAEHLYRWEKKLAQSPVTVWQVSVRVYVNGCVVARL